MLQWIYHVRPAHSLWEGTEDILFTTTVRGASESLKSSVYAMKSFYVGKTLQGVQWSLNWKKLNAMEGIGSYDGRAKWHHSTTKAKRVWLLSWTAESKQQSERSDSYKLMVLVGSLAFLKVKDRESLLNSYLIYISRKELVPENKNLTWIITTKSHSPSINSQTWASL